MSETATGATSVLPAPTVLAATRTATLSSLRRGEGARVVGIDAACPAPVMQRLCELGFCADASVHCLRRAPLGSPTVYRIGDADLCLRKALTDYIQVELPA